MYIYICIYVYMCMFICIYICIYICLYLYMYHSINSLACRKLTKMLSNFFFGDRAIPNSHPARCVKGCVKYGLLGCDHGGMGVVTSHSKKREPAISDSPGQWESWNILQHRPEKEGPNHGPNHDVVATSFWILEFRLTMALSENGLAWQHGRSIFQRKASWPGKPGPWGQHMIPTWISSINDSENA